ncbi:MAG: carbon monoxide dehydrogenase subunit G [Candidatus Sulfopaludibacter sp.]|nr:carbon monoxide dehydrogenase subunit G [Candidatus Sulfopaludibacter sp.]
MKLTGSYTVPGPRERAYALLQDPAVLAQCMPGCEGLDRIGENEYAMRMKMTLASISGRFEGKVRISDANPPESFRLMVEGSGKIGFVKGDGLLTLSPAHGGTSVRFEGDVQVGGTIANVGQRLVETTARMLIKRFFDKLAAAASVLRATESAAD